jgi:NAD(P)H-dependent FMN reductase
MKRLLIVWTSTTFGTARMVEAAYKGAVQTVGDKIEIDLEHARDANASHVLAADALLFATPEHLASMAGQMKDFFERIYYPCLERVNGKPYALMVCAGSDGQPTIKQVERIATGLRLKRVAEPLLVITHAQTPEAILAPKTIPANELARCASLGGALAAGLETGVF